MYLLVVKLILIGENMALSPMMQQYNEIKSQYTDCILFFRLGDFYEMFFEDALIASNDLEISLTGRNCGLEEKAPMCGVPFHSADNYIARLIDKGHKVAICEQVEDPKDVKGIVKREVVQIITPGTVFSQVLLSEKDSNYISSIFVDEHGLGITYCDITTGEIYTTQITDKKSDILDICVNELSKIRTREVVIDESSAKFLNTNKLQQETSAYLSILSQTSLSHKSCEEIVLNQFQLISLNSFGMSGKTYSIASLALLIQYLKDTQKRDLKHLMDCKYYNIDNSMVLDKSTIRNLEITEGLDTNKTQGSLLGILDKTQTAMGGRKIKKWLREPLCSREEICRRLDAVEELVRELIIRRDLRKNLADIYDFERLMGRVSSGNANGRDMISLKESIAVLPFIKECLLNLKGTYLRELSSNIDILDEVHGIIQNAICDEPPLQIKEGGLIKPGYSQELDDLKYSIKDGKQWIANLENSERNRTGIKNIKVGYNKVFGYYLEITKSYYDQIPEDYIRKQTLSNCERFVTPKLKEMESLVLNAEAKINLLEYNIFIDIRKQIEKYIKNIQTTSHIISTIDVLCSFAEASNKYGYVKPIIEEDAKLEIVNGRHPVVEHLTGLGLFVPNDVHTDNMDNSMLIITGPNMAGKSTYMRQTALIVLMAQAGCFVPCEYARIGVFDRIFTRIGASDNLSQGQSTFYVEMSELAYILNNATTKSLVILDEIGRGTSTYDGLSIAWATVKYLCNENYKITTLFATHYHELTELQSVEGVKNLNVDVTEEDGNVVFLHKIVEGIASKSYGIYVAKIAGVPTKLLTDAKTKLAVLEKHDLQPHFIDNIDKIDRIDRIDSDDVVDNIDQDRKNRKENSVFDIQNSVIMEEYISNNVAIESYRELVECIDGIDLMETTPSMAIKILEELKQYIYVE